MGGTILSADISSRSTATSSTQSGGTSAILGGGAGGMYSDTTSSAITRGGTQNASNYPATGGMQSGGTQSKTDTTGGAGSSSRGGNTSAGGGAAGGATGVSTNYYLSDLCALADSTNAWGPIEKDLSNGEKPSDDGGPITVDGKIYSKGLGGHAPSDTGLTLGGNCTRFTAIVGIDDEMRSSGSILFEVWGDGKRLYQSALLTGASVATSVDVDISGVQQLRLVLNDNGGNGSDHGDWADAKVVCNRPLPQTCPRQVSPPTVPVGYHLQWSDEFDREGRPNPLNWSYEQGFVRNQELQYYQEANASVEAGFLIIEGRRERLLNPNYVAGDTDWKKSRQYAEYSSASLQSNGKQTFQYGRFEMRGRIAAQPGLWPAWWTLGVSGEWPSNGEIDIMEYYNNLLHANVACGTTTRWQAKWDSVTKSIASFNVEDWDSKFHVWRMDWDNQTIALYVDDFPQNTTSLSDMLNPDGKSPFQQSDYILLNLAIGGQNGGDPANTAFPSRFEVDYVRVYQK